VNFGVRKFRSLLLAGSFTVLAGYIVRLTDSIIAGNLIGSDALAGINLVAPLMSAVSFLGGLLATGMGTNYSISMGRLDRLGAHRFFTQAIWSAIIFGGALSLVFLFGRDTYLSFMGADAAATAHAADYMRWYWPVAVMEVINTILVSLGYADGDSKLCMTAYTVLFVSNAIISVGAVLLGMGTAGCAMGSVVSEALSAAVMVFHFFGKTNSCRFVRHFSLRDSWRIAAASFGDAAAFLCDALLLLFLNKFLIARFGSELLPVLGVAMTLWGFLGFFNGIGVAIQPIVTVYYGEGNTKSVRTVMSAALWASVIEGVAFMAVFLIWPELVIRLVGVSEPELVREGCLAVRCMCGGFVALAFAGLFNSYYMFVERAALAGVVTFACYLLMPVFAVAACSLMGPTGIWCGLGIGPFLGCAVASLVVLAVGGKARYPLMLDMSREKDVLVAGLEFNEQEIVSTSRQVAGEMIKRGIPELTVMRTSLMTEEVLMAVRDRNRGRKVIGEVVLDMSDGVVLTLRDDGEIFDITDSDAKISSLRSFLVASVMERQAGRVNLVTTGFNRNVFRF